MNSKIRIRIPDSLRPFYLYLLSVSLDTKLISFLKLFLSCLLKWLTSCTSVQNRSHSNTAELYILLLKLCYFIYVIKYFIKYFNKVNTAQQQKEMSQSCSLNQKSTKSPLKGGSLTKIYVKIFGPSQLHKHILEMVHYDTFSHNQISISGRKNSVEITESSSRILKTTASTNKQQIN